MKRISESCNVKIVPRDSRHLYVRAVSDASLFPNELNQLCLVDATVESWYFQIACIWIRDGVVSIATGYGLDDR
jgi:hypothetical protein